MAASSSSSSITNDGYEYDVFLSFRGPDTRLDFTGNLWNALHNRGIRTFRDDLEINKGNNIKKSLFEAIEKSKAAIVVLSPSYATSSFCLDELCHILKCMKEGRGRFVWPIFYDVDPSTVRWLKEPYGEALAEHRSRNCHSENKLQEWEKALNELANLSGTVFKWKRGNEYEYMFINEIVQAVSTVIRPFSLSIPDYLFGLETQKQDVLSLLNVGSDDKVYMVGIHGIGGIGKTTLAQVVYNSIVDQFDGSCYLEDVRRNTEKQGLMHLQNSILSKIFGENKIVVTSHNDGIKELEVRLKQKKVLLLLDNVDKLDQLQAIARPGWFGRGSRVIITTRDRQVVKSHGVESTYEVKELNKKDAYDFLRSKTLKSNEVSSSHEDVFNRAVTYVSGLPLAIEIMGSYLFTKKEEEWSSVLARYERIPKEEIFENLKVSFDALAQEDKDVFLDIACFFKGANLERVKYRLHAHYGYEIDDHINVLIEKSLIKIIESNVLTLHDRIEDMGKEIVRLESPHQTGERSRLWSSKDVLTLHDRIEDMGKEIVRLESPHQTGERSRLWSSKDIVEVLEENRGTSKIGIMMFPYSKDKIVVNWDGDAFKNMTNLRTLVIKSVDFSESPKHLPNSIRVLEWDDYPSECFPVDFFPRQLTIFKLTSKFYREEDFFKKNFKNIKSLILQGCDSLRSILDDSFIFWSVRSCQKLTTIPSLKLPLLEELILEDLSSIESLSTTLDESLDKLKFLTVGNCEKLTTIPSLKLPLLEELTLERLSSIESLSPTLDESLDKLKILSVACCIKLTTIPSLKLPLLEKLTLHGLDSIESLSPTLDESLDKLKILIVRSCEKLTTIPSLKLPLLEELALHSLLSIESLSPTLDESLDKLKILSVKFCGKLTTIPSLKLPLLEELDLSYLSSVESLSPLLDEPLDKLKILTVERCNKLTTIPSLKLPLLEELDLSYLSSIESLSPMLDEPLDKLKILTVRGCNKLTTIHSLKLPLLEELDLSYLFSIESLSPMLDESLEKLKILIVRNCKKLTTIPSLKLLFLEELTLEDLSSIESLSPMLDDSLDKLKILRVRFCTNIKTIPPLKLPLLEDLTLDDLSSIESLSPMLDESLDKLKILTVKRCNKLTTIPSLKLPLLEELDLSFLSSIESVSPTLDESLDKLKILRVHSCPNIKTIPPLKLASLEKLYLQFLPGIESFSPTLNEPLDKLKVLWIEGCTALMSFPPVMLPSLENLNLSHCKCLKSFPPVMLPSLEILDLSYCECLESFPSITSWSMAKLKILRVSYCKKLRNIPASNWDSLDKFYSFWM